MTSSPDIALRPFTREDAAPTFAWVSRADLREAFLMRGVPTPQTHQAYFERALADPRQRIFAVLSDGVHVGNCGLGNIEPGSDRATLWIYVGDPAMRGRGIGGRATRLLVREAFGPMNLAALDLCVASDNTAAIRLYRNLGFEERPLNDAEKEAWGTRAGRVTAMTLCRSAP